MFVEAFDEESDLQTTFSWNWSWFIRGHGAGLGRSTISGEARDGHLQQSKRWISCLTEVLRPRAGQANDLKGKT